MSDSLPEKFDPSALMEGVRDRIKSTFVSLIPDSHWDEMVKKVIDDWFTHKEQVSYSRIYVSEFEKFVYIQLEEYAKPIVQKKILEYQEFSWDNENHQKVNSMIEEMITKNAGKILTNIIGEKLQQIFNTSWR